MPATAIPSWTTVAASLGNWGWWLSLQVVLTPSDRKTAWHPWASVVVCSTLSEPLTGLRPGYCELGSATNAHRNQTARFFAIHQQARNAELPGCLQLCMALYQSQNFLASHERLRYHVAVLSVPEHIHRLLRSYQLQPVANSWTTLIRLRLPTRKDDVQ